MIHVNMMVDAKGLSCPMPIVKSKKAINELQPGQVLEIQATDKGSKADIKAWAESTGHQYIGTMEEGNVLKHYIRKVSENEEKEQPQFPHIISNEELLARLNEANTTVLDVREQAEYAFGHIPGALSLPLGELEQKMDQISKESHVYVICRTGNRSDLAAQKLMEYGFLHVWNVVPGMSQWTGPLEKEQM
ncbi:MULTISPECIES: sulfurtransferase TusA family protein [unclassified Anoxybacillus]|uniref:sulfurtransferase TusA family protein n=1 Tax=unclassified Anoxybacillus TaxID=2639704 RepID=UPI0005CD84D9|nr:MULTISPECIES: sulfurtransferase TusA family protein [unclassified Anoxybacillus]